MAKATDKNKGGRPSKYSQELADRICAKLMEGMSLRAICKEDDMPSIGTVCVWLASGDESFSGFQEQYARARQVQAELLADEIIDIADDSSRDTEETDMGNVTNYENIQRSKLRIDTRKWIASKLLPKKYGDKLDLNHSGPAVITVTLPDEVD
jgi:hypothetical protein